MSTPRKLKVYGWTAFLLRGVVKEQHNRSFRCIVAAPSKAAVMRLTGATTTSQLWCISETGNAHEVATASAKPGTVFYQLDTPGGDFPPFTELRDPTDVR